MEQEWSKDRCIRSSHHCGIFNRFVVYKKSILTSALYSCIRHVSSRQLNNTPELLYLSLLLGSLLPNPEGGALLSVENFSNKSQEIQNWHSSTNSHISRIQSASLLTSPTQRSDTEQLGASLVAQNPFQTGQSKPVFPALPGLSQKSHKETLIRGSASSSAIWQP